MPYVCRDAAQVLEQRAEAPIVILGHFLYIKPCSRRTGFNCTSSARLQSETMLKTFSFKKTFSVKINENASVFKVTAVAHEL